MPYIKQDRRSGIDPWIQAVANTLADDPGELNYAITRLIVLWIAKFGGVRYARIATVTGVLKNVADEFYRRVAGDYEDVKEFENGDVYGEIMEPINKAKADMAGKILAGALNEARDRG